MERKKIFSSELLHQLGALDVTPGLRFDGKDVGQDRTFVTVIKMLASMAHHCEGDAIVAASVLTALHFGALTIVTSTDDPQEIQNPKWLCPHPLESNMYRILDGKTRLTISFVRSADLGITTFRVATSNEAEMVGSEAQQGFVYTRKDAVVTLTLQGSVSAGDTVFRGMIADLNLTETETMFMFTLLSISGRCLATYPKLTEVCIEVDHREISQIAPDQPANVVALQARNAEFANFFGRLMPSIGQWKGVSSNEIASTQDNGETIVTVLKHGQRSVRTQFCLDRLAAQARFESRQELTTAGVPSGPNVDPETKELNRQIASALPGISPAKVATLTAGVLALATAFDAQPSLEPETASRPTTPDERDQHSDANKVAPESADRQSDPEQLLFETTASRRAKSKYQGSSSLEQLLDNEVFFS